MVFLTPVLHLCVDEHRVRRFFIGFQRYYKLSLLPWYCYNFLSFGAQYSQGLN